MPDLPTGTVTFLFTDIEGSTRLWEQRPEAMRLALLRHDTLLNQMISVHSGIVFKTVGDAFCAAFDRATDAVTAALAMQRALQTARFTDLTLKVRMALHTGEADTRNGDYFGTNVNRVARLLAIGHGGQTLLSQATQQQVRENLPESAGLRDMGSHRLKDLQEPEHVWQLIHPELPVEFPRLRSQNSLLPGLPPQTTSFVGREREIAEIGQHLTETRLLTLTGAGGAGKTRLMLYMATLAQGEGDGVCLVELAPLSDPALVTQTTAQALGVREEPGRPLIQTLTDWLRPKRLLLALDNCEHVLAACAQLADTLLYTCPEVTILATSREGLGIAGEVLYRVPPLSTPDPRQPFTPERLRAFESVRLFLERATAVAPRFAVTASNAQAMAQVCYHLDGIPLAIELAAARVRALPVEQIAARLDDRFRLLTGGSRTALARQQTLRAAIDWSYDLLTAPERTLLRRLSVFSGGWTLETAEAVCAAETPADSASGEETAPAALEAWEILDLLTALVDKSLVVYEEHIGEGRYRMLETVRQYARERLTEFDEETQTQRSHRDYYLTVAEETAPLLTGREQAAGLARLEAEHDNLRAALEFCLSRPSGSEESADACWRLVGALARFWEMHGYLTEGRGWGARARNRADWQERTGARAYALLGLGVLASWQTDYAAAHDLLQESLDIARERNDSGAIAAALNEMGSVARRQGDTATALTLYAEALERNRAANHQPRIAVNLGNLALTKWWSGAGAEGEALFEEALVLHREIGNRMWEAIILNHLGIAAYSRRDFEKALAHQREGLRIRQELGDKRGIAESLETFAALEVVRENWERAARFYGAAAALRESIAAPLAPSFRPYYDQRIVQTRAALGAEDFTAAWTSGRALTLEEILAQALYE